ncbi:MAG TPA: pilus assembly PilX N-terminal domain-containing protein [Bacillota bacterium]|nr:pilus assembly PilX N-terminal domain-containing protein [Bacillota bacterium]
MLCNQKGYALIIVLVMTIVLFFTGSAALTMGSSVRKTAVLETDQKKAYYIAEAGIEKAIEKARQESIWVESLVLNTEYNLVPDVIPAEYADGNLVHVKVRKEFFNDSKTTLNIESKGRYRDVYRQIRVKVDLGKPMPFYRGLWTESPPDAPSSFKNNSVIHSDVFVNGDIDFDQNCTMTEDIWVGGNVTIYNNAVNTKNLYSGGAVNIKENGQVSGNIQAVGDVTLYNNAAVGGEIRSMGNVTLNKAYVGGDVWANGSVFNDKSDVGGNIYTYQSMDLRFTIPPFPELDLDWYSKNADYYYFGSQTWSGDLNLNGLYYIEGDLTIEGGTYSGVATVVVSGTVRINGNLDCTDIEQDDLCILSAGNVTLDNKKEDRVRALIYSPATVTIDNNTTLCGSLIARTLKQNNNAEFYFEPKMENNQPDWVTTSLKILSWEEI